MMECTNNPSKCKTCTNLIISLCRHERPPRQHSRVAQEGEGGILCQVDALWRHEVHHGVFQHQMSVRAHADTHYSFNFGVDEVNGAHHDQVVDLWHDLNKMTSLNVITHMTYNLSNKKRIEKQCNY